MDDRAESGVGTMIIFIALVLVAAVAAAVVVGTSGMLQERASATGNAATKDVASNLQVLRVEGYKDGASGYIDSLNFTMELAAGSSDMDLGKLMLVYNDGSGITEYTYDTDDDPTVESDADSNTIGAGEFGLYWVRSASSSITDIDNPVMEEGDLVRIHFPTPSDLEPRSDVSVDLIPESGSTVTTNLRSPSAYGTDVYVTLR